MTVGVEMMWGGGDGVAQGDGQAVEKDSETASSSEGLVQRGTSPSRRPAMLRGNSLDSLDASSVKKNFKINVIPSAVPSSIFTSMNLHFHLRQMIFLKRKSLSGTVFLRCYTPFLGRLSSSFMQGNFGTRAKYPSSCLMTFSAFWERIGAKTTMCEV